MSSSVQPELAWPGEAGDDVFARLLDAVPDAMFLTAGDGRILLANHQAERLFGYPREELAGEIIEILTPERFRGRHAGHRKTYLENPRIRPTGAGQELQGLRKDGSEFPVEISFSPLQLNGTPVVISTVRDITERRRSEEKNQELKEQNRRVQQASRLKSEFLANMSHELRTPLNGIIGFTELLHDGVAGPVSLEQREYLGDVLISSRHLLRLIDDILDLAKVEAGKIDFRPEPVSLEELVGDACNTVQPLAAAKHIPLRIEVDASCTQVVADAARLKEVLFNYLSNAIKFTPDEGRVIVRVRPEGPERFRLEVEDTGIGIQSSDIAGLFTEFYQLDTGAGKRYQGTGLGLALTRRIVEAQGGSVGVASVAGRGSTFHAVLPRLMRRSTDAQRVSTNGRGRGVARDDE